MKERCSRQQRRVDELEQETVALHSSRNELYSEIKKLHEANVLLRERNLSLGRELHSREREGCQLRSQWEEERDGRSRDLRQLERLQEEVMLAQGRGAGHTEGEEEQAIASLQEEPRDDPVGRLAEAGAGSMLEIAGRLAEQRERLVAAVRTLQQRRAVQDQAAEQVIASCLAAAVTNAGGTEDSERRCPMCEVVFPAATSSQEQFETHVVDHFSYEEASTLANFDTVPDAFWPAALQNQSLQ
jgi:hypothetical protein